MIALRTRAAWPRILLFLLVFAAATPSLADPGRVLVGLASENRIQLVGAWDPERGWMPADSVAHLFQPETPFTLYGISGRIHEATLKECSFEEVVADWWGTTDRALPDGMFAVALAGAVHDPAPRLPRSQSLTSPTYRQAGAAALARSGIRTSAARLAQSYRIDLDDNGTDEVLLTLRSRAGIGHHPDARRGDYAGVLLRYLPRDATPAGTRGAPAPRSAATPASQPLILNAWPRAATFMAPEDCQVIGCVDVDGDGRLETFTRTWYYEGSAVTLHAFDGKKAWEVLCRGWGV